MSAQFTHIEAHWMPIAPLFAIRNDDEYDAAVDRLNQLVDQVGTNEAHPLYGLLDTLGTVVASYEAEHHGIPDASGPEVLEFLLEEHGLGVDDLPEIGPAEDVQRYLAGGTDLSVEQVRNLARRFHVSPAAFI